MSGGASARVLITECRVLVHASATENSGLRIKEPYNERERETHKTLTIYMWLMMGREGRVRCVVCVACVWFSSPGTHMRKRASIGGVSMCSTQPCVTRQGHKNRKREKGRGKSAATEKTTRRLRRVRREEEAHYGALRPKEEARTDKHTRKLKPRQPTHRCSLMDVKGVLRAFERVHARTHTQKGFEKESTATGTAKI